MSSLSLPPPPSLLQVYVFEGISKNVTTVGFYENGQFMYSGGEDATARIWDLRMGYVHHSTTFLNFVHKNSIEIWSRGYIVQSQILPRIGAWNFYWM